jgi:hypothetical protein
LSIELIHIINEVINMAKKLPTLDNKKKIKSLGTAVKTKKKGIKKIQKQKAKIVKKGIGTRKALKKK